MKYVIAGIMLFVLIIIYNAASINTNNYEKYLYGLWTGDDEFCDQAGIDSIMLFIGEPDDGYFSTTRNAYMIIVADNGDNIVCNQGLTLKYSRSWSGPSIAKYTISTNVDFDNEQLWSENGRVKISVDMKTGQMWIREIGGEKLYAKLYKSNEMSKMFEDGADFAALS